MVHRGSMWEIPDALSALFAWIGENGYSSAGPYREMHLYWRENDRADTPGVSTPWLSRCSSPSPRPPASQHASVLGASLSAIYTEFSEWSRFPFAGARGALLLRHSRGSGNDGGEEDVGPCAETSPFTRTRHQPVSFAFSSVVEKAILTRSSPET